MTRPPLEVADVVQQYGAAYLARYGPTLSAEQHRALRAIAVCRTAALGGYATQCDQYGHEEISYNSCRNRHCPKCQVAYLLAADIVSGPLPIRLREVNQPVIITRNRCSRSRPRLLTCL
jgi:hypothetical protein